MKPDHMSTCEDGPDECIHCARIVSDRIFDDKVKSEMKLDRMRLSQDYDGFINQ